MSAIIASTLPPATSIFSPTFSHSAPRPLTTGIPFRPQLNPFDRVVGRIVQDRAHRVAEPGEFAGGAAADHVAVHVAQFFACGERGFDRVVDGLLCAFGLRGRGFLRGGMRLLCRGCFLHRGLVGLDHVLGNPGELVNFFRAFAAVVERGNVGLLCRRQSCDRRVEPGDFRRGRRRRVASTGRFISFRSAFSR